VTCDVDGCREGYGRSLEGTTCIACGDLTFDNCALCENEGINGTACFECESTYTMRDDWAACLDCGSLTDCSVCEDRYPECSVCDPGYELTKDLHCAYHCFVCGDRDTGDWRSEEECGMEIDTDDPLLNYTVEACAEGFACYVYERTNSLDEKSYVRGCYPNALDDRCEDEDRECQNIASGATEECELCCIGNRCNTWHGSGANAVAAVSLTTIIGTVMALALMK